MRKLVAALLISLGLASAALAPAEAQQVLGGSNTAGAKPVASTGANGQFYIDWTSGNIWGPKSFGAWPSSPITTFAASGGSGTPGGTTGQVQYNAGGGLFGGIAASTWDGTTLSLPATALPGLTGLVKGNDTSAVSVAANGTDFTLITANTCSSGNHVSAITAAGIITCSPDSGGGGGGVTIGNAITGSCTSGFNLYNNGGVIGCQANGGGGGTVSTTGSPVNGNLTKFSAASTITNGDLSGDVATSGTLVTTIQPAAVSLTKIANASANAKLLGSGASGGGASYSELTPGGTLKIAGTTLDTAATTVTCTSSSFSTAEWKAGKTCVVKTAAQTLTLLASSGYDTNGGVLVQTGGQSVTLTPTGADTINGVNAPVTISSGLASLVTTDGLGAFIATPTVAGGGSGTVSNCSTADAIAYYSATGTTVGCLASVGTSTQVLTSNGPGLAPTWQAAGGGGTPTCPANFTWTVGECVWVQTASASSDLHWTGLTGSAYRLECDAIIPANGTSLIGLQFGEGGTPAWAATAVYENVAMYTIAAAPAATSTTDSSFATVQNATTGAGAGFIYDLSNLTSTTQTKRVKYSVGSTSGTSKAFVIGSGYFSADTNAITAIRLIDTQATPTTFNGVCSLVALH